MYKKKKIIAIIPARGGSKGIPNKNIKVICGKPLISWTIKEAKKCRLLDKIVVTTDSTRIADISVRCGAQVPFLRPKYLASDSSSMLPVVLHVLDFFEKNKEPYDIYVLLQPTSPLRSYKDIAGSIKSLFKKDADTVVSVTEASCHPFWMNTIPNNGSMRGFLNPAAKNKNRQDLPRYFQVNGAVKAGFINSLKEHKGFFTEKTYAYVMPKERSVDIDNKIDFDFATLLLHEKLKK